MRNHRLTLALASGMAGLALFASGCSGSSGGGAGKDAGAGGNGSDAGADGSAAADKAQALRGCLRKQGMDVPDLKPGENPNAQLLSQPQGTSTDKWNKALTACGSGVPGGDGAGAPDPGQQDQQVKIAQCLRGKGFDMPDPKVESGHSSGFKIPEGADPDTFMKALNECAA
ncbi:hypothetical protein [Streptomyces sp. NBC_00083]|uniref:hypothetical protein n=1 Tax=Streptomyces sp. NBC_00083 TaxID=2975647 RepID=UPI002256A1FD|nr:hypothetical protein [Streptomyces sp. NBC_00083]MCX5384225.1 hypothetical protein [Streptomyces sp. NBC_00083]